MKPVQSISILVILFLASCSPENEQIVPSTDVASPIQFSRPTETATIAPAATISSTATIMPTLQIPGDALVAYYPFEGSAEDASGNHNDGTLYGPVLTSDRFGRSESAYYFDGDDDYIEIQDNDSLEFSYDYSMAFWLAPEPIQNQNTINLLSKIPHGAYSGNYYWYLGISQYPTSHLSFFSLPNVADATSTTTGGIPDRQWTCVVFTYHAADTAWTFYLNGLMDNMGTHNRWQADTSANIIIGGDPYIRQLMYQGSMDEFALYQRSLSAEEALNYCANYPGGGGDALVSFPTAGPTATQTPTFTPTISLCRQGWSHLAAGEYAILTPGGLSNRLRDFPFVPEVPNENTITLLDPGTIVRVLQGPECSDGLVFWKVEVEVQGETLTGWIAEGDGTEYWLEPYQP